MNSYGYNTTLNFVGLRVVNIYKCSSHNNTLQITRFTYGFLTIFGRFCFFKSTFNSYIFGHNLPVIKIFWLAES